mgnify:CR=1 FL=1|tara:strand:+ start:585 stop:1031 length:447 start_codon:yes stop_codon:yes gene_type:complete
MDNIEMRSSKQIKLDKTYMSIAKQISNLSYCKRKKVGSIIVKNNNILSFGYNGSPSNYINKCEENNITHWYVLHAESNAIAKISRSTQSSEGATLYSTLSPCVECAKLIIQSGIKEIIFSNWYKNININNKIITELFNSCNVKWRYER